MHQPSQVMPADFPLWRNEPLPDAHAKALRTALARETALQNHLEQQHIEMEIEASKTQDIVSSLVTCHATSERVHELLHALRAAVTESKDLISNAINVHNTEAEAADKLTTTTAARTAWGDLIQLLEALTPQINATITSTQSHTRNAYSQVCTHKFLAECTRSSIAALDLSLDAIATSLSFKRKGLTSLFRIPDEVFERVFQFVVEEECEQLRSEFSSSSLSFDTLDDMRRTIPKCPFTLAAVCRVWRNIALHTPKLWSYIRVYTSFGSAPIIGRKPTKYCWVGKTAFETSLQRAKGTPLELAIYQDPFTEMKNPPRFPPDARVAIIDLIRLAIVPQWLPSCSRLSLFWRGNPYFGFIPNPVEFPSFPTEPKEISCDNVLPTFRTPLDSTISFYFSSKRGQHMPHLNQLSEKLPNLEILQLLLPDASAPSPHPHTATPRTWKSLTTLRITSSVLPFLAGDAQKRPSLPSLTTLILTNVFASFSPRERDNIKDVVQTVTSLEIHNISPSVKPSELRTLVDWMGRLHTVTLHRVSVQKTVKALSITPAKSIKRLVIEGTVLEEVELHDYTTLLMSGSESVSGDSEREEDYSEIFNVPPDERHPSPDRW